MIDYRNAMIPLLGNELNGITRVKEKLEFMFAAAYRNEPSHAASASASEEPSEQAHPKLQHLLRIIFSLVIIPVSSIEKLIDRIDECNDPDNFESFILNNKQGIYGQKGISHPSHVPIIIPENGKQPNFFIENLVHHEQSLASINAKISARERNALRRPGRLNITQEKILKTIKFLKGVEEVEIDHIIKETVLCKDQPLSADMLGRFFNPIQIKKLQRITILFEVPIQFLLEQSSEEIMAMMLVKTALQFERLPLYVCRNSQAVNLYEEHLHEQLTAKRIQLAQEDDNDGSHPNIACNLQYENVSSSLIATTLQRLSHASVLFFSPSYKQASAIHSMQRIGTVVDSDAKMSSAPLPLRGAIALS